MTARDCSRPRLTDDEARRLADVGPAEVRGLMTRAAEVRDAVWGRVLTYSPKVFLPLTNLCRNRCEYCAFRRSAGDAGEWTITPDQVDSCLSLAVEQGCFEALVCLGDTPETAFPVYRKTLATFGHERTVEYIEWACERALSRGLLPHTNAGILTHRDMLRLKSSNASLGLMLENVSTRLCRKGMPHHRAPDKRPAVRLQMLEDAGKLAIPFTTGILVGIGETALERVEALLAIARLHLRYGHIQEVIVQNFTPHEGTPMSSREPLREWEVAHAIALARLVLPDDVSVQAPPNLNAERTALLVASGINDFGGISPVTVDYINPDCPWPQVTALSRTVSALGFELSPRLSVYDAYIDRPGFLEPALRAAVGDGKRRLAASVADRAPWREASGMRAGAELS